MLVENRTDAEGTLARSSAVAWALLTAIVVFGVVYNNILRWYPFPPGRSANDITSLQANLVGIILNMLLYAGLLAGSLLLRGRGRTAWPTVLLYSYCCYVALQTLLRPALFTEAARSLSLMLLLLSAERVGRLLGEDPHALKRFVNRVWVIYLVTIAAGILIGLTMFDAVNWGAGRSPTFTNQNRAEFFFFYVLPHTAFAFSLYLLWANARRPGVRFVLAGASAVTIAALAMLTMTRTILFSLILLILVFLFRFSRKAFFAAACLAVALIAVSPGKAQGVAERLRVAEFFASDPSVDATSGRLILLLVNYQSFRDSPFLGQGAQEARNRIAASGSTATTEHGYSIHFASYGIFAGLLVAYVLAGVYASARLILARARHAKRWYTGIETAVAALALASFFTGFFWTFGSAASYYDWLAVLMVSIAQALWRQRRTEGERLSMAPAVTVATA